MGGRGWAEVAGAIGLFTFATTVVTVIIVQFFRTRRARTGTAGGEEYRQLATMAIAGQESIDQRLADLGNRLAAIEQILKQVE
jgi:hypothetical protein